MCFLDSSETQLGWPGVSHRAREVLLRLGGESSLKFTFCNKDTKLLGTPGSQLAKLCSSVGLIAAVKRNRAVIPQEGFYDNRVLASQ